MLTSDSPQVFLDILVWFLGLVREYIIVGQTSLSKWRTGHVGRRKHRVEELKNKSEMRENERDRFTYSIPLPTYVGFLFLLASPVFDIYLAPKAQKRLHLRAAGDQISTPELGSSRSTRARPLTRSNSKATPYQSECWIYGDSKYIDLLESSSKSSFFRFCSCSFLGFLSKLKSSQMPWINDSSPDLVEPSITERIRRKEEKRKALKFQRLLPGENKNFLVFPIW